MTVRDDKSSSTPLDPTTNAANFIGDGYGISGITKTDKDQVDEKHVISSEPNMDPRAISDARHQVSVDTSSLADDRNNQTPSPTTPHVISTEGGNKTLREGIEESTYGEQSISGDMPDPEAGADITAVAQESGLYLDENEEDPQPVDVASQVDKAEEEYRSGKPQ